MVVTNYAGEIVEWQGTKEEALRAGLNINCESCTRCKSCVDCYGCIACSDCIDCKDCRGCSACKGCSFCINCWACVDCKHLRECKSCGTQPIAFITTPTWTICYRANQSLKIGDANYSVEEWLSYSDEKIESLHSEALYFWRQWRPVIEDIYKATSNKVLN